MATGIIKSNFHKCRCNPQLPFSTCSVRSRNKINIHLNKSQSPWSLIQSL